MATHEDAPATGAATIALSDAETLRVGDSLAHADLGSITATRIVAEGFGKTAYFSIDAAGDLGLSLSGTKLREQWGETVATDAGGLTGGGQA